jgi:hypothetical protein
MEQHQFCGANAEHVHVQVFLLSHFGAMQQQVKQIEAAAAAMAQAMLSSLAPAEAQRWWAHAVEQHQLLGDIDGMQQLQH